MKFKYLAVLVFFVASAFGAARAQNVKGVVYGADTDEPLIGASVYWAGTTVGTGADAEGNYTIHRVVFLFFIYEITIISIMSVS